MNYKISFQERAQLAQKALSSTARYFKASQNASGKTNPNEFTKKQEAA